METIEYQRMFEVEERHWWYAGLHDLVLRQVRREAERLGRPLDLLDAGCGTGRLGRLLQPFGRVSGCDIHPLALAAAARRGIGRVFRCDLAVDDLGAECYDLIACVDVLYHHAVADEAAALANLRRALKHGGLLLLQVPAFETLRGAHDATVHTRRRYRRVEIVRLLETAGFAVEWASYRLFPFFAPALLWRRFTRRFPSRTRDGRIRSDAAIPLRPWLQHWLKGYVRFENRFLSADWRLPCGTSVFARARRLSD